MNWIALPVNSEYPYAILGQLTAFGCLRICPDGQSHPSPYQELRESVLVWRAACIETGQAQLQKRKCEEAKGS
jgi:hypothetical protein